MHELRLYTDSTAAHIQIVEMFPLYLQNGSTPDEHAHLCDLVDFAIEMKTKLDEINKHSFNKFQLRIGEKSDPIACSCCRHSVTVSSQGISTGPLVCGVIGATKPVFDIWGDTVNEASRMDSTGTMGCIQVSEKTATVSNLCCFLTRNLAQSLCASDPEFERLPHSRTRQGPREGQGRDADLLRAGQEADETGTPGQVHQHRWQQPRAGRLLNGPGQEEEDRQKKR